MNLFDIIILLFLTIFVYVGAKRGMVQELLGLSGWILSLLLAIRFGGDVAGMVLDKAPSMPVQVAAILGFIAVLFLARGACQIFIQFFQKLFNQGLQSKVDRFFGALFGFIKGAFFTSVLVLLISILPLDERSVRAEKESLLFGHMEKFSLIFVNVVIGFVPQIQEPLEKSIEKLEEFQDQPPDSGSIA